MLEDLEKEVKMYKSWQREAEQLGQDENLLEIREPYNEDEENKWREKHRDRVKQEKQSLSKQAAKPNIKKSSSDNDDNFWQRLDELELEEELDAHLEAQEGLESNEDFRFRSGSEEKTRENDGVEEEEDEEAETEEDDDWSVSPPLSDVEEEDEEETETEVEEVAEKVRRLNKEMDRNKIQVGSGGMGPKRSVSFGDVSERLFSREQDNGLLKPVLTSSANAETTSTNFEAVTPTALNTPVSAVIVPDTKVIEFQPSRVLNFSCENVIVDFDSKNTLKPSTPGDLVRLYGSAKQTATPVSNQRKKNPKKSILKAGSKYGPPMPIKTEQVAPAGPQLVEPPPRLVKPKFQAVSAVKDRVVERERGNSASGEATKKPVTQVLSRFRATRVHQ